MRRYLCDDVDVTVDDVDVTVDDVDATVDGVDGVVDDVDVTVDGVAARATFRVGLGTRSTFEAANYPFTC